MPSHRITFEGPADLAIGVATALAEADGVELTSSDPITKVGDHAVRLDVTLDGSTDAIAAVITALHADLPSGATITAAEA